MFIITSIKKNIRATSGTNNDIEFHNKLFNTDDCVITWQADPTPEEIAAQIAQNKIQLEASRAKEILIADKVRGLAISALQTEGKLNASGEIVKGV